MTEHNDYKAYKNRTRRYDVLESEWTLKAYEKREKTRKIREAIELNIFGHSETISNPEKNTNIDTQPSKIPDLSISEKSDLNKTISSQNNTEI
ncbi:MAG: hypothetical protein ACKOPC_02700, partial [Methylocystis sp.]